MSETQGSDFLVLWDIQNAGPTLEGGLCVDVIKRCGWRAMLAALLAKRGSTPPCPPPNWDLTPEVKCPADWEKKGLKKRIATFDASHLTRITVDSRPESAAFAIASELTRFVSRNDRQRYILDLLPSSSKYSSYVLVITSASSTASADIILNAVKANKKDWVHIVFMCPAPPRDNVRWETDTAGCPINWNTFQSTFATAIANPHSAPTVDDLLTSRGIFFAAAPRNALPRAPGPANASPPPGNLGGGPHAPATEVPLPSRTSAPGATPSLNISAEPLRAAPPVPTYAQLIDEDGFPSFMKVTSRVNSYNTIYWADVVVTATVTSAAFPPPTYDAKWLAISEALRVLKSGHAGVLDVEIGTFKEEPSVLEMRFSAAMAVPPVQGVKEKVAVVEAKFSEVHAACLEALEGKTMTAAALSSGGAEQYLLQLGIKRIRGFKLFNAPHALSKASLKSPEAVWQELQDAVRSRVERDAAWLRPQDGVKLRFNKAVPRLVTFWQQGNLLVESAVDRAAYVDVRSVRLQCHAQLNAALPKLITKLAELVRSLKQDASAVRTGEVTLMPIHGWTPHHVSGPRPEFANVGTMDVLARKAALIEHISGPHCPLIAQALLNVELSTSAAKRSPQVAMPSGHNAGLPWVLQGSQSAIDAVKVIVDMVKAGLQQGMLVLRPDAVLVGVQNLCRIRENSITITSPHHKHAARMTLSFMKARIIQFVKTQAELHGIDVFCVDGDSPQWPSMPGTVPTYQELRLVLTTHSIPSTPALLQKTQNTMLAVMEAAVSSAYATSPILASAPGRSGEADAAQQLVSHFASERTQAPIAGLIQQCQQLQAAVQIDAVAVVADKRLLVLAATDQDLDDAKKLSGIVPAEEPQTVSGLPSNAKGKCVISFAANQRLQFIFEHTFNEKLWPGLDHNPFHQLLERDARSKHVNVRVLFTGGKGTDGRRQKVIEVQGPPAGVNAIKSKLLVLLDRLNSECRWQVIELKSYQEMKIRQDPALRSELEGILLGITHGTSVWLRDFKEPLTDSWVEPPKLPSYDPTPGAPAAAAAAANRGRSPFSRGRSPSPAPSAARPRSTSQRRGRPRAASQPGFPRAGATSVPGAFPSSARPSASGAFPTSASSSAYGAARSSAYGGLAASARSSANGASVPVAKGSLPSSATPTAPGAVPPSARAPAEGALPPAAARSHAALQGLMSLPTAGWLRATLVLGTTVVQVIQGKIEDEFADAALLPANVKLQFEGGVAKTFRDLCPGMQLRAQEFVELLAPGGRLALGKTWSYAVPSSSSLPLSQIISVPIPPWPEPKYQDEARKRLIGAYTTGITAATADVTDASRPPVISTCVFGSGTYSWPPNVALGVMLASVLQVSREPHAFPPLLLKVVVDDARDILVEDLIDQIKILAEKEGLTCCDLLAADPRPAPAKLVVWRCQMDKNAVNDMKILDAARTMVGFEEDAKLFWKPYEAQMNLDLEKRYQAFKVHGGQAKHDFMMDTTKDQSGACFQVLFADDGQHIQLKVQSGYQRSVTRVEVAPPAPSAKRVIQVGAIGRPPVQAAAAPPSVSTAPSAPSPPPALGTPSASAASTPAGSQHGPSASASLHGLNSPASAYGGRLVTAFWGLPVCLRDARNRVNDWLTEKFETNDSVMITVPEDLYAEEVESILQNSALPRDANGSWSIVAIKPLPPLMVLEFRIVNVDSVEAERVRVFDLIMQQKVKYMAVADMELPPFWSPGRNLDIIRVDVDSAEWKEVEVRMKEAENTTRVIKNLKIVAIDRVQNLAMWVSYRDQRRWLHEQKYQRKCDVAALERRMWHGTRSFPPQDLAVTGTGWDASYSSEHCRFGQGSYFAAYPFYSNRFKYYFKTADGSKQLILADVLTGATVEVTDKVKRAPFMDTNPAAAQPWQSYVPARMRADFDSVYGQSGGEDVTVVFCQGMARAYPRYIITYTSD